MSARKYLDETGLASLWAKVVNAINALGDQLHAEWTAAVQTLTSMIDAKVSKSGDTMTGNLTIAGNELHMGTTSSSSNDSGDIVWYFGNGQEKSRLWMNDAPTDSDNGRLNYRVYKSDGTQILSQRLATSGDVNGKVSKSGDTMSGVLTIPSVGGMWVQGRDANKNAINVAGQANNNQSYDGILWNKCYNGNFINIGRIGNELDVGYIEASQTDNSLRKFVKFAPAEDKLKFGDSGQDKGYIKLSDGGFYGNWNGITMEMGTNNTTDTWVPVQTGSKWQHRVIPTDYNNRIIGDDNHAASTGAALSSDTGRIGLHWYSQTGKIANQPTQYGFLLTCATAKGAAEQHSIFMEQANGSLYHMGTNGSSSGSPPAYKKIYDSGNLVTSSVGFTRSHASVSYQEGLVCNRFGNVVTFAGYFSCGATIAANVVLYSGLPKPAGGKSIYFTWSGYDFFLHPTDGTIRTNGQIISRTYVGTFTYVCA